MPAYAAERALTALSLAGRTTYVFIGDYKYWLMTHWVAVDLDDGQNYVLNRGRLYRDRRDFVLEAGDTGKREDYPVKPARSIQRGD